MRFVPREAQRRMIDCAERGSVLLAAPPGAGKTAAVLQAVLNQVLDLDQVLWVAPKVVVESTVPNEIAEWDFPFEYRIWSAADFEYQRGASRRLTPRDPAALKAEVLATRAHLHLVSKDHFAALTRVLGAKDWPYQLVVLDESWAFSDRKASRWAAAWSLRRKRPDVRWVLLNGTPYGNGLEKVFYQMALVDGGASLGTRVGAFREEFMEPETINRRTGQVYKWRERPGAIERLAARCQGAMISIPDPEGVPPLVVREVAVDIPREHYEKMEAEALIELADSDAVALNAGAMYNKLAQIASGLICDSDGVWHELHREKLAALASIADAHAGPLLIWTQFREDISRIRGLFPKARVANEVRDLETEWNAGRIQYLIAHPGSLAAGANLQKAEGAAMVWFSPTGNALHWNQGIKRLHRPGRVGAVECWVLVARGTVEQRMLRLRKSRAADESDLLAALRE